MAEKSILNQFRALPTDHTYSSPSSFQDNLSISANRLDHISCTSNRNLPNFMPRVDKPGVYTAWVPINGYHVTKTIDVPYCHYFGDALEDVLDASKLHSSMLSHYSTISAFDLVSDGELDDHGNFKALKTKRAAIKFESLTNRTFRAAQRYAILKVVSHHGNHPHVWAALSHALNIPKIRRMKTIYSIACKRKAELEAIHKRREAMRHMNRLIVDALTHPKPSHKELSDASTTSPLPASFIDTFTCPGALTYYCSACCQFACDLHENMNVIPLKPIPDLNAEDRINQIEARAIQPCSRLCFFLPHWRQEPVKDGELEPWTTEEVCLFREGVLVVGRDPCSLAIIIGSRTCRAVKRRISQQHDRCWIKNALHAERRGRRSNHLNMKQSISETSHAATPISRDHDCSNADLLSTENHSNITVAHPRKTAGCSELPNMVPENSAYIPCEHEGQCLDNPSCICFTNNLYCQSRCGCNGTRLTYERRDIVWKGVACGHSSSGCQCRHGNCLDKECSCVEHKVACDPDTCACNCTLITHASQIGGQRCRNANIVTRWHKKKFVGKSEYGLGLFAGEFFEKGDVVGVYGGELKTQRLVDESSEMGMLDTTYFFDITEDVSIDAKLIGSKVKFVNNANNVEEGQNCESHFLRIRGEAVVCLRTIKDVNPGEEFFFDYKLKLQKKEESNKWYWEGK